MKEREEKDKKIFNGLRKKDKDAFALAYDKYLDNIYRFVYFKVGNKEEAEDLTSHIFLKTWDYIRSDQLTDYKTLKAFLYKVARNRIVDHYRKKSNREEISLNEQSVRELADHSRDLEKQTDLAVDYKKVAEKMFELKEEYREVITLKYINQLSIGEIAEILEKSKGNIRVLVFRALKSLRELLDEE